MLLSMCASLVLKILFRSACAKKGRERRFCCNAIFKENVFQRVERCRQFVSSCWPLRVFVVEAGNNERQSRSPKVVELPWQCRRRMSLGLFSSSWFASFEKKSALRKKRRRKKPIANQVADWRAIDSFAKEWRISAPLPLVLYVRACH